MSNGSKDYSGFFHSIAQTSDGGYVVTGTVNDSIWMIKFAPETIAPTNGESPPFQTTWIVVALIMAVVVGISALVYLKKRKH